MRDYWDGFWRLSAARPPALSGAAAIPVSEIRAYTEGMGHTGPHELSYWLTVIQIMDVSYRSVVNSLLGS